MTENFEYTHLLMLSLAATMFVIGLIELKKDKKGFWGYITIGGSLFAFYVAIEGFF